jgi:ribokinase
MPHDFAVTSVLSIDHITPPDGIERVTVGSCGFYVGLALARLGAKVLYAGAHGTDFQPARVDILREAGADVVLHALDGATARLDLVYAADGNVASAGYDEGVGSRFRVEHLPEEFWKARILWSGTAPLALQEQLARRARPSQPVYLSTQNEFAGRADQLVQLAPHLAMLFANSRELARFGFGGLSAAIETLFRFNPALTLVITRGARGAWSINAREWHAVASVPGVRVVNTTGAGDTFGAAYALQRLHGAAIPAALRRATTAAALSLRGYAYTRLPTANEVDAYFQEMGARLVVAAALRDSSDARRWIAAEEGRL